MNYYQLSSKSPNPETPDKTWFAEAKQTILCKECASARVTGQPIDVVLQTMPDRSALNVVHGVCVQIATVSLLKALFPEGPENCLLLGKVFGPDRKEAVDFVTIMKLERILIRGNERSEFRVCPDCHRIWYSTIGKRYLLKRDVGNISVFESQFGGLVVAEPVAQRVIGGKWRNLVIQKLELRDEPVDGLDIPV
ncbi:MAG TPA: hypothetical protein VK846_08855 [Candidatus Limnocylindria bacterium]|nr:hypothetical protein [Candidatus Limnocylindria bacterium]